MITKKTTSKKTTATKKTLKVAPKKTKTVAAKKTVAKSKVTLVKKTATKKVVKKSKAMPALKKTVQVHKVSHGKESRFKRMFYMTLSVLLGLLLGTFVSLFVELVYMRKATAAGVILQTNYFLGLASYLPFPVQPVFLLLGLIFGIWLGFWGWKMVYIERRHRMYRK